MLITRNSDLGPWIEHKYKNMKENWEKFTFHQLQMTYYFITYYFYLLFFYFLLYFHCGKTRRRGGGGRGGGRGGGEGVGGGISHLITVKKVSISGSDSANVK